MAEENASSLSVEDIKERYRADKDAWSEIYLKAEEDMRFLSDEPYAQWYPSEYAARARTGRPTLTVDHLGQFIHQVTNEIRQNTPTITVIPSDITSTKEDAEIYKGLIKEIEYASNADAAYDMAAYNAVRCSIGFIRVEHDYNDDESFEQKFIIKSVANPLSCWIDSNSIEPGGRDAMHGTALDTISVYEFKKRYPDKEPCDFDDGYDDNHKYEGNDLITLAEHFYIEEAEVTIVSTEQGVIELDGAMESMEGLQMRTVKRRTVRRCLVSGKDILEETLFPGSYIPIIPVYGEEYWVNNERYIDSLIRKSKDSQRQYNLLKSVETEFLMKAPLAPILAPVGTTEDFAEDYIDPSKTQVLRYKPVIDPQTGQVMPPPTRLQPVDVPIGIVNAARTAIDDIKATMGIYNAALGQRSNETSGIAIRQRTQESDMATYHFSDNLIRAITQLGRVIVSGIPKVYDTPRIVKVMDENGEVKNVGINGMVVEGQERTYDLTKGKFSVHVVAGASNTTRRQETADFLSTMLQGNPELINRIGDVLFDNMDFTGAEVLAERMRRSMPPELLEGDGQDPVVMALQAQLQQANQLIQGLKEQLSNKQAELSIKAQGEQNDLIESERKTQIAVAELELKLRERELDHDFRMKELALKEYELALKEAEMRVKMAASRVPDMMSGIN